jgi:hypothetical protein
MPPLPSTLGHDRTHAIVSQANKWANGTVLHYYFFNDKKRDFSQVEQPDHRLRTETWVGSAAQQDVVRQAFAIWKAVGIGLEFVEVKHREDAEIRIGFMAGDGSWSYIGTDIVSAERRDPSTRTINYGWDLRDAYGLTTALHEIGHTLGLPHEHMSPFAGIEWDRQAVYAHFSQSPNYWSPETIDYNILNQLDRRLVKGSHWDPDSVMEYAFPPGLIKTPRSPIDYWQNGLTPPGGLSEADKRWVRQFYPPLVLKTPLLLVNQSLPLEIPTGGQANFAIEPVETRYYDIRTFGKCDILLALFEYEKKEHRYRSSDDDSGQESNATLLKLRLFRGHRYVLRVRLKYRESGALPSVMMFESVH